MDSLAPFAVALGFSIAAACVAALIGLRKKKRWAITLGLLAVSVLSLLFPVCAIGIWALADPATRRHFRGSGGQASDESQQPARHNPKIAIDPRTLELVGRVFFSFEI